jgi:hypothetical protein
MKKTIFGIILFLMQISLAIFYNSTIDLVVIISIAFLTFGYILYRYFRKDYDTCEI